MPPSPNSNDFNRVGFKIDYGSLCARLFSVRLVHTYFMLGAQKLRSRHGRKD
jgi:hypothetical protein